MPTLGLAKKPSNGSRDPDAPPPSEEHDTAKRVSTSAAERHAVIVRVLIEGPPNETPLYRTGPPAPMPVPSRHPPHPRVRLTPLPNNLNTSRHAAVHCY